MKIINSQDTPWEKALHGPYMKQVFIGSDEVINLGVFGKVVLKPGQVAADHGHEGKSEIYLIEKGKGKIIFNRAVEKEIGQGDTVITNADETHELSNPYNEDLELLFIEIKS